MTSAYINSVRAMGAALRQARLDAGLTQEELSAKAAVSRRWLGLVENGRVEGAEMGRVFQVLRALGIGVQLAEPPTPEGEAARVAQLLEARR